MMKVPIDRATLSLLRENDINNFILQMKLEITDFQNYPNQIYELLSITRNNIPTLASVLNFGIYPQGLLPQLLLPQSLFQEKRLATSLAMEYVF